MILTEYVFGNERLLVMVIMMIVIMMCSSVAVYMCSVHFTHIDIFYLPVIINYLPLANAAFESTFKVSTVAVAESFTSIISSGNKLALNVFCSFIHLA